MNMLVNSPPFEKNVLKEHKRKEKEKREKKKKGKKKGKKIRFDNKKETN